MDDNQLFDFDSPLNQSSYIKVIGVGGGGNNAVNHMFKKGITGVDFIVSNTDMKALNGSPVPNKLVLGHDGMGAGGRPSKARKAALEKEAEIKELFSNNTKMVFITAGMGGGTGTGAAPVIAQFAKEIQLETEDDEDPGKILVVAVVTTPFNFEGNRRIQQANEGVEELRKYVDSILVINNEKLRSYGNLVMSDAFSMANDVLLTAVKGIAEIITLNAYVNIDFRDVNTVMENSGTALMGIGEGEGENRALQAVEQATTSVLLNDNDIAGAKNVLLYFSYGPDHEITMDEMGEVADYITSKTGSNDTNVIWGTGFDEELGEKVKITLIATGFEQSSTKGPNVTVLKPEQPKPAPAPVDIAPASSEPRIVTSTTQETPHVSDNAEPIQDDMKQDAPQGRVFVLEDEPVSAPIPSRQPEPVAEGEAVIINRSQSTDAPAQAVRPVVEQAPVRPQPIQPVQPATGRIDMDAMNRAARIKMMHDLLRNDVNGPQIVECMSTAELTGENLYEAAHSAQSEATSIIMNADGTMCANKSLYDLPD